MFRPAEGVLLVSRGITEQTPVPSLWSVLGGQEGGEKELRIGHLPSLGSTGGPRQVQPHVGSISTFCSDSGLVLFPCRPPKGREQVVPGERLALHREP